MEREQIISEIDTKIKYAKFINTDAVVLSSKAAQFCLEHAQYYEQKIKELTEENERLKLAPKIGSVSLPEALEIINRYCESGVKKAKADTVRKFAEKLKTYYNELSGKTVPPLVAYHIEQIEKEFLCDSET